MSGNDVVYADVKFLQTKRRANEKDSSDVDTTYSEVKVNKTKTSSKPSDVPQHVTPSPGSKVTAALVIVVVLLVAAVVALAVIVMDSMQTKEMLRTVKTKSEADRANFTELLSKKNNVCHTTCPPPCPPPPTVNHETCNCDPDWEQHGEKCYYFSTDRFPWDQSRQKCVSEGAGLVTIGSRTEQEFLEKRLRSKMKTDEDKFWIGLTDSETEGRWVWADGTLLTEDLSFWRLREPDNWMGNNGDHPNGEDCVRMGEKRGAADLLCWVDHFCEENMKRICAKPAVPGILKQTCV